MTSVRDTIWKAAEINLYFDHYHQPTSWAERIFDQVGPRVVRAVAHPIWISFWRIGKDPA